MTIQQTPRGMSRPLLMLAAIALAVTLSQSALAADSGDASEPLLSFSGFGTLGVVHSSEDLTDFTNGTLKATGAGFTDQWSAAVDSTLGAQAVAAFTPQLSATLQIVSEQLTDNSYRPHVEWANLKYQVTPDLSIRVGRTLLSSFMFSDTRKVGYANPWVRPPVEAYSLIPVTTSDGADATYKLQLGRFSHTLVGLYGQFDIALPPNLGGGKAKARRLWQVADTIEHGSMTFHAAYQSARITIPHFINQFFDGLREFGPQGIELADRYDQNNKLFRFVGVGAMYDPGKWFVIGEWGNSEFHSALGKSTAWYVSSGYRFGKLTPYLTFSQIKADGNTSDPGLDLSLLPVSVAPIAEEFNAGLNDILVGAAAFQQTMSAGVRWDVFKNAALKLQYDHVDLGAGSVGTLINVQPGFQKGGTLNLVSLSVDFVL
ncbi:MAG: porin [Pseudomonadota bacterium]